MGNVVSLVAKKQAVIELREWASYIDSLDKLQLLEEMIKYQELRLREDRMSDLMIRQGQILFGALTQVAETKELRHMVIAYHCNLNLELARRQA